MIKQFSENGPVGVLKLRCTTAGARTRALTALHLIKPTSTRCRSARPRQTFHLSMRKNCSDNRRRRFAIASRPCGRTASRRRIDMRTLIRLIILASFCQIYNRHLSHTFIQSTHQGLEAQIFAVTGRAVHYWSIASKCLASATISWPVGHHNCRAAPSSSLYRIEAARPASRARGGWCRVAQKTTTSARRHRAQVVLQ
jgi:hypothetical protein